MTLGLLPLKFSHNCTDPSTLLSFLRRTVACLLLLLLPYMKSASTVLQVPAFSRTRLKKTCQEKRNRFFVPIRGRNFISTFFLNFCEKRASRAKKNRERETLSGESVKIILSLVGSATFGNATTNLNLKFALCQNIWWHNQKKLLKIGDCSVQWVRMEQPFAVIQNHSRWHPSLSFYLHPHHCYVRCMSICYLTIPGCYC